MATVCAPPSSPAGAVATLVCEASLPQAQFCGQSLLMPEPPAPPDSRRCPQGGPGRLQNVPVPRRHLATRSRRLLRWRCRRRRLANRRFPPRAPQDPVPGPERRPHRVQAVGGQGARQDVEGRGLEGLHAWEWHQLHSHRALLSRPVRQLQLLPPGKTLCLVPRTARPSIQRRRGH